jgi:hypothetical protein
VAISNHRLVSFNDGQVTFRWRDSAHNNDQKLMTLSLDEFPAPLPPPFAPQGLCPHPPLRFPRQSSQGSASTAVLCSPRLRRSAIEHSNIHGPRRQFQLVLSEVWRTHANHREIIRRSDPTSLPTHHA